MRMICQEAFYYGIVHEAGLKKLWNMALPCVVYMKRFLKQKKIDLSKQQEREKFFRSEGVPTDLNVLFGRKSSYQSHFNGHDIKQV